MRRTAAKLAVIVPLLLLLGCGGRPAAAGDGAAIASSDGAHASTSSPSCSEADWVPDKNTSYINDDSTECGGYPCLQLGLTAAHCTRTCSRDADCAAYLAGICGDQQPICSPVFGVELACCKFCVCEGTVDASEAHLAAAACAERKGGCPL